MNYLQKIMEFGHKYINQIKAKGIKKKIMKNDIDNLNSTSIGEEVVDVELIEIVLQDPVIVEKLCKDNKILYYISSLDKDKQLIYLNSHMSLFNDTDINTICEWALNNIEFEDLLKTDLGTVITGKFPRECYEKIQFIGEDKLQEINNNRNTRITSFDIARKILESQKTGNKNIDKKMILGENISARDKIEFIKSEGINTLLIDLIELNDKDKIEFVNGLNIPINPNWIIYPDISDEFRECLISRATEKDFFDLITPLFPAEKEKINIRNITNIRQVISILGKEKINSMLTVEQQHTYNFLDEIFRNFDEEQICFFIHNDGFKSSGMEMNFIQMHFQKGNINPLSGTSTSLKALIEINDADNGLGNFKNYYEFRKENNGLDYFESLYSTLFEYKKYNQLYNSIISDFQQFSSEEKMDFQIKWNGLMAIDNKFGIKNIQDFKRIDEIEREYYSNMLKRTQSPLEIKQSIFEILVRDNNIENITKLGNGTTYSMENKGLEDVVDLLSTINEITDLEALRGILNDCIDMIGSEEIKNIRRIGNNIQTQIIQEYRKGYTQAFTNYDEMSDEELAQIEGIGVKYKNGIRIIELKGADFAFLSHNGRIDGNNPRCCCSQITPSNYETFGGRAFTYIYSKFSPNRIKLMNIGDAGFSPYQNTYISSEDMQASSAWLGSYNEVTISTGKEKGDDGLNFSAIMTNKPVNSSEFNTLVSNISASDYKAKTIYVLHEDIYAKKREKESINRQEQMQAYLSNLDPKLLNMILSQSKGSNETREVLIGEIKKHIAMHICEKYEKGNLRRNVTRYWQMSREKTYSHGISYNLMNELQEELQQMDNQLTTNHLIKTKIKEVSSKHDYER